LGVDVVIEVVGMLEIFEFCIFIVWFGGWVVNVGVYGYFVMFYLEMLWICDVMITTGFVDMMIIL